MKMTKKQTVELLHIVTSLEAALGYLERNDVEVFMVKEKQGDKIPGRWYSELFSDKEAEGPMCKFSGCNLAMLPDAINSLRKFIKENQYHNHPLIF